MSQIPPASGSPYGPGPYGPGSNAPSMGVPAHAPYAPPGGPVNAPAPYGPGLPQATVKSTRGPVVLLTIGIILVVAAVAALGFAISSVAGVADSLNEINGHGNSQVTLEENGHYGLYGDSSTECTVRNPDGGEVSVRTPSASIEINNHQMFGSFNATKAGEYTVTCNSLLNTPVYLGEGVTAGGILNSAAGIVLAILGLVIGAVPMTHRRPHLARRAQVQQPSRGGRPGRRDRRLGAARPAGSAGTLGVQRLRGPDGRPFRTDHHRQPAQPRPVRSGRSVAVLN